MWARYFIKISHIFNNYIFIDVNNWFGCVNVLTEAIKQKSLFAYHYRTIIILYVIQA